MKKIYIKRFAAYLPDEFQVKQNNAVVEFAKKNKKQHSLKLKKNNHWLGKLKKKVVLFCVLLNDKNLIFETDKLKW